MHQQQHPTKDSYASQFQTQQQPHLVSGISMSPAVSHSVKAAASLQEVVLLMPSGYKHTRTQTELILGLTVRHPADAGLGWVARQLLEDVLDDFRALPGVCRCHIA